MKLDKVLNSVNQIEKSSFLKIIDSISNEKRQSVPEINKILSGKTGGIKDIEYEDICRLLDLIKEDFKEQIINKLNCNEINLDIILEILIRDGNSIMSKEWFYKLVTDEIKRLEKDIKEFQKLLEPNNEEINQLRKRDYLIYRNCVKTAFENGSLNGTDTNEITFEERIILNALAKSLGLSIEEVKLINYSVTKLFKVDVEEILSVLKEIGVGFYNRKSNLVYVPDEIIWIIREILGIDLPMKKLRRIITVLTPSEISKVVKNHNINRKLSHTEKIEQIISYGINITDILTEEIFNPNTSITERKKIILEIIENRLGIKLEKKGATLEERVRLLIEYYEWKEKENIINVTKNGFEKLLIDLNTFFPDLKKKLKKNFYLQEDEIMTYEFMSNHNLQPVDILSLLSTDEQRNFCKAYSLKQRGDLVWNILNGYYTSEDILLENYILIGEREVKKLNENGIKIKDSEVGLLFEDVTKNIMSDLGFSVDEALKKELNTKRLKIDILINLGRRELILIECKSSRDFDFSKYTSVTRQLKSYVKLCEDKGFRVLQTIVVANEFSDDFISECEYDINLSLSLLPTRGLLTILKGFKSSPIEKFPYKLLLRNGLLDEDRIVKRISK